MSGWDGANVERWLVYGERADRREHNPGHDAPLAWPRRFVPDRADRASLRLWVWCQAHDVGFAGLCDARGLKRTSELRRKQRAVDQIVRGLNAA